MRKIKYTCKECGWGTSIWEQWEDLKPQRCMNRKCNTSFRVKPDSLLIEKPEPEVEEVKLPQPSENRKDKKHGKHNKD